MVTIKVCSKSSGKPVVGARVSISFNGLLRGVSGNEFTDSNGEAHFNVDPGSGKVFVRGDNAFEGDLRGRVIVYT